MYPKIRPTFFFGTVLFVFSLLSCENESKNSERKSIEDYSILVNKSADSLTRRGAEEIRVYVLKVSGFELPIVNEKRGNSPHLIVGGNFVQDSALIADLSALDEDGFLIKTLGEDLIIAGKNDKANLYAAYSFIEEFLGCRLLSSTEEYVPENKTLKLPKIDKIYNPSFSLRRPYFPGVFNEKYRFWHKIETLDEWGSFVHTFTKLLPPDKYYDQHPEYYALVGKERVKDGQICLSNAAVIQELKNNLAAEIEKNPTKKYWSVSQNDCYNYCECKNCQKLYDQYESISGAYVYMANELAKTFPDKHISTLAYQFTREAPKNIKPLPNVNIMFCSIECNRSMPLADDKRSADFVKDMRNWAALTNNIFAWDYIVQFENYLTPFPNFHTIQPNIQFYADNNVGIMFQQGSGRNWSDFAELKQYLVSKLLWDKNVNTDSIIDDFITKYYGAAGASIKSYFDAYHVELIAHQEKEFLNIYGFPVDYMDSYLTPDLLVEYKRLMDEAESLVQGDSIYSERVQRTRLPVDFAYLDIALNHETEAISFFDRGHGQPIIRDSMVAYLNRFVEQAEKTGVPSINEKNLSIESYQSYALRRLEILVSNNKLEDASILSVTPYANKYPVGGLESLRDKKLGGLHHTQNWLGYEGKDMVLEIDLKERKQIKSISTNFLRSISSWIFLPREYKVEVSADGNSYSEVGKITNEVDSKDSFLIESIPYTVNFTPQEARYLRLTANSLKTCPSWHRGFGRPSWIFLDELVVN